MMCTVRASHKRCWKDENEFLDNKHRFHSSSNGYAYINQTSCIVRGKKQTCYKFGITEDIKSRIRPYKTGNPTFKMLYYIPLKIDMNQLETCIISVMMPHEVKKNNETVSFTTLKELKSTINNCARMIANHVCHCNYCKQQLVFNDIDIHNCSEIGKLTYISPKASKSSKSSKKGSKLAKSSEGSKLTKSSEGSKLTKSSKGSKLTKASKKGSKLAKSSKGSKLAKSSKGSKLAKSSKGSKLAKSSKGSKKKSIKNSKLAKSSKSSKKKTKKSYVDI